MKRKTFVQLERQVELLQAKIALLEERIAAAERREADYTPSLFPPTFGPCLAPSPYQQPPLWNPPWDTGLNATGQAWLDVTTEIH